MVELVPMNDAEFAAYCATSVEGYAQENIRSGRWTAEEAHEQAARQYAELLPAGAATPDHYLSTVRDTASGESVGLLWFAVVERGGTRRAFVYDVAVSPEFRRRGYGEAMFKALEERARELGLAQIDLHVFGHNHAARTLYEKLGFVATNIQMTKML